MGDRGQMKLSFGMIFSIILIIIFVAFAGYAIMKLLGWQNSATSGQFITDLQGDVDRMWHGGVGSEEVEYRVPQKVKAVCFTDYASAERGSVENMEIYQVLNQQFSDEENLFFYPIGSSEIDIGFKIDNIDILEVTREDNPLCFEASGGKVRFVIKMDAGESLVKIENE